MEKPILFSTKMVQAILEGRKTQTRRVIKSNPINPKWTGERWVESGNDDTVHFELKCPYGKKGNLLWVRETWCDIKISDNPAHNIQYKADYIDEFYKKFKWKPSIFMPKKYCRLWLEVVDVRVERLQEISKMDAKAEGVSRPPNYSLVKDYVTWFRVLWNSINEKRGYGWSTNPYVWVVEFKKIEKPM